MGDVRFEHSYDAVRRSRDQAATIQAMSDEQVVEALTAATLRADALLSNVLATEATNRIRRLRAALANLGEGVLAMGADGAIVWMNPAAERLLGVRWQDLAKRRFASVIERFDERGGPLAEDAIARAAEGSVTTCDAERWRLEGGKEVCVSYTSAPIGDEDETEGIVVAFQDCSERKAHERDLRVSRERYETLFREIDVGIVSVGADGAIVDANAAADAIVRRSLREARGRPWSSFLHPDDRGSVQEMVRASLEGQRTRRRLRLLHEEGGAVAVDAAGIPMLVDGEVAGLHVVLRNV